MTRKMKKNKNTKVTTPLLGKNGFKYRTLDKAEIFADNMDEQFAVYI